MRARDVNGEGGAWSRCWRATTSKATGIPLGQCTVTLLLLSYGHNSQLTLSFWECSLLCGRPHCIIWCGPFTISRNSFPDDCLAYISTIPTHSSSLSSDRPRSTWNSGRVLLTLPRFHKTCPKAWLVDQIQPAQFCFYFVSTLGGRGCLSW